MKEIKKDMFDLVIEAKEEIEKIQDGAKVNGEIIEKITSIRKELLEIEKELKPYKTFLKERIKILDSIINKISNVQSYIISINQKNVFEIIQKNLPNDMKLKGIEDDEDRKIIYCGEEEIGIVEVLTESENEKSIKVEVCNNTDVFPLKDPLKVYDIISFIITKFNYKEV